MDLLGLPPPPASLPPPPPPPLSYPAPLALLWLLPAVLAAFLTLLLTDILRFLLWITRTPLSEKPTTHFLPARTPSSPPAAKS